MGFSKCAGCRISPSVGYPGILIPDSSARAYGGVEHSFRGLRTSDRGTLPTVSLCFVLFSLGRVLSGGCARAHPPGVAPEALEGCGTPSRALIERVWCFCVTAGCARSPRAFSFDHSVGRSVGAALEPPRVARV
jgi:hypothetical protein